MSEMGFEPTRCYPHEPESCASTNFATPTDLIFNLREVFGSCQIKDLKRRHHTVAFACSTQAHFTLAFAFVAKQPPPAFALSEKCSMIRIFLRHSKDCINVKTQRLAVYFAQFKFILQQIFFKFNHTDIFVIFNNKAIR